MKERANKLFKDKLVLVMMVLGLLTIVAAAGTMTIHRGNGAEETPYLQMGESQGEIAENKTAPPETKVQVAGPSNARESENSKQLAENTRKESQAAGKTPASNGTKAEQKIDAAPAGAGQGAAAAVNLNFTENSRMVWPVEGNILLDYSMDSTIYFPTLDQYKCNPGIVIQGEVSNPVKTPADAKVAAVGANEEIGNYVVLDLGNDYSITCGQLKEVQAEAGDYLEKGQVLGYVAEPTKYYCVEGSSVYVELTHQGAPIDPVDFME
ncbi:MAG: M23 family metallopeptidase [Lachnospiraceae bacterium]|nr:M23 family metallopeptidase [Lachnospiraceae bacterium]MCI9591053.1 M23 family metallopeptidase [Lachnospiraceae bacterium]